MEAKFVLDDLMESKLRACEVSPDEEYKMNAWLQRIQNLKRSIKLINQSTFYNKYVVVQKYTTCMART